MVSFLVVFKYYPSSNQQSLSNRPYQVMNIHGIPKQMTLEIFIHGIIILYKDRNPNIAFTGVEI